MIITLTYFGRLTELTGKSMESLDIKDETVRGIRKSLEEFYPTLCEMTYQLAANNSILNEDDSITVNRLDVFPPFSGG